MAEIVLGLGTSHSSQLSLEPGDWAEQAELDRRRTPFEELAASAGPRMRAELEPQRMRERHERAQAGLRSLAAELEMAAPDALVVVGDDQSELFRNENMPAVAIATADTLWDLPPDVAQLDPIRRKAAWAFHAESPEEYPMAHRLARYLTESLVDDGFDVAVVGEQPPGRTLGHAWTFVRRRLMGEAIVPLVPVFLNTYYPPNQPTPKRCAALGAGLARAIRGYEGAERVGVVASGGLSHFVVDEDLDRLVLDCLALRDFDRLSAIPRSTFRSGTSEILNWIAAVAALRDLPMELIDYIPAYRSEAGTGCGFAFAVWKAP